MNDDNGLREDIIKILVFLVFLAAWLTIFSLLTSCSTQKHITEQTTTERTEHLDMTLGRWLNTSLDRHADIVIYDTSLPIDTPSGKPPVKAEIRLKERYIEELGDTTSYHQQDSIYVETEEKEELKSPKDNMYRNMLLLTLIIIASVLCIIGINNLKGK